MLYIFLYYNNRVFNINILPFLGRQFRANYVPAIGPLSKVHTEEQHGKL